MLYSFTSIFLTFILMESLFGWANPVALGVWMAGVGVFFWGLPHLWK